MRKKYYRLLSAVVLVSIIAGTLPFQAIAVENSSLTTTAQVSTDATPLLNTEAAEVTQPVIVREDVSLRDEFVKHFEMSDGSYTATVYNEPVHQLVDGAWVEVDNSLQLSTSAKGAAQYQTVNGLTDVSFAQNYGNELVTMEQDNHSISWGVEATVDSLESAAVASAQLADNFREPAQAEILPLDLSAGSFCCSSRGTEEFCNKGYLYDPVCRCIGKRHRSGIHSTSQPHQGKYHS